MAIPKKAEEVLVAKTRSLPEDKVSEVEDFVEFLRQRDKQQQLTQATSKLSEVSFAQVWDNPEDADYD